MADNDGQQAGHDLEPQQFQRMYWEADVPVKDIRHRLMHILMIGAIALFLLIVGVAALVKFPNQITIPFVLRSDQQEQIYKFPFPVYLLAQHVVTGQVTSEGAPLLEISSPEIVEMIYVLDGAQRKLDQHSRYEEPYAGNERQMLAAILEQNQISQRTLANKLESLHRTWKSNASRLQAEYDAAVEKLAAYRKLFEAKDVSRFDVTALENEQRRIADELESGRLEFEKESLSIEAQRKALLLDYGIGRQKKTQLETRLDASLSTLNNDVALARAKIEHLFGPFKVSEGHIVLLSPGDGTVSYLFEGEKEMAAGATLLRLKKDQSALYAFAKCPPAIKGKLREDLPCLLKVHSFSFYEYGSAGGHIRHLSLSPDEDGNYNVHIQIDKAGQLEGLLQGGLNGDAVIIIQEKTMLQYFFRGIKKSVSSFMEGKGSNKVG